jgi:hypothetical protein
VEATALERMAAVVERFLGAAAVERGGFLGAGGGRACDGDGARARRPLSAWRGTGDGIRGGGGVSIVVGGSVFGRR